LIHGDLPPILKNIIAKKRSLYKKRFWPEDAGKKGGPVEKRRGMGIIKK
jgi:hypothetical protein